MSAAARCIRFTVAARTRGRGGVVTAASFSRSVVEVDSVPINRGVRAAIDALSHIAFLLERTNEPTYRVRAFRNAATTLAGLPAGEVKRRYDEGTLEELAGIGKVTAGVIGEAMRGETPSYLAKLQGKADGPLVRGGAELRAKLRGDLHTHSDWSDGGSPIEEMMRAAIEMGHEYAALTDHSPRLTVARGLSPDRLREQLDVVRRLNDELAPFRILTGIEVDILDDGGL
ncbi:MAG: PHP domain-containing protein, partial [Frankiaceae bacterium]|nr:PHP domain-containing protein [Frankiaceae bacterium]